jgi:hypothetical protein
MNKYLEKLAERDLKQDAREVALAGGMGAGFGAWIGKNKHETRVKNLNRGGNYSELKKMHVSEEIRRAKSGHKIATLMDKAFKKRTILGKAKTYGTIAAGLSIGGHILSGNKKSEK